MSNFVKWILGIAAAAAFAYFAWWQSQPGSQFGAPQGEPQQTSAGDPAVPVSGGATSGETVSSTQPAVEPEPAAATKPEPVVPEFDVVRVSSDGLTVIAGRAAPEQTVEILLDGVVIAEVTTDAAGQFATDLDLPQTGEPQQLLLRVTIDGRASDDVAVSVLPDPQAVAAAEQASVKASEAETAARAAAEVAERAAVDAQAAAERALANAKVAAERATSEAERAAMETEAAAEQIATERAADAAATAIAAEIAAAQTARGEPSGQVAAQPDDEASAGAGSEITSTFAAAAIAAADAAADAIARDLAEAEAAIAAARQAERRDEILTESRAAEEAAVRAADEAARRAAEAQVAAEVARTKKAEAETATRAAADAAAAAIAAEIAAVDARAAADAGAGSVEPKVRRQIVSAPVIILPSKDATAAPVLVQPDQTGVTLLQPSEVAPASQITLDRITYSDAGAVVAAGRGRPGSVIRIYGNAEFLEQVTSGADGQWQVEIDSGIATSTQLLRFDAIDAAGNVVGRLETPFEYSPQTVAQELKQREIVVQKGDHLWKFATQHYGEGWRYSVIFSANSELIRDPDLIYPGQVFKVPELVQSQ